MKSPVLIGLAWAATVALAFLLGGQMRPASGGRDVTRTANVPAAPGAPQESKAQELGEKAGSAPKAAVETDAAATVDTEPAKPVTITEGMDPAEFSSLFMKYAAKKLAEGPEGQKELYRELDRIVRDKSFRMMMRDETQAMPLLYPWIRFLVDRDRQVVGMMETVYKTAAEDPNWFEGTDNNTFEVFAEGLAVLLPGIADEEQMGRFRGYAEKITSFPKESLPEALQRNQRRVTQDLEWWSPPVGPDELASFLSDPTKPLATKLRLLRRADLSALKGVDLNGILAQAMREGQSEAAMLVSRLPTGTVDIPTLDQAFIDGAASGTVSWYHVMSYVNGTGRTTWATMRPLIDAGLARGGQATETFAQSLVYFPKQAPKEYVSGVLASYTLPDQIKGQLRKIYGLE
jgi:hypothetical protein